MAKNYFHIIQVSALGSSSCDLKCSYCYLREQHKNSSYSVLNNKIQKAWKDGSYLENIKKIFNQIKCNPKEVSRFELWGGEPLISVKNLIVPMGELAKYFSNLTFFLIPTNWAHTDTASLAEMIANIDKNISPRATVRDNLQFHLQLSIDGPPGDFNLAGHSGNWELYKLNIKSFCEYIKQYDIKNTTIIFEVHPTASKETIFNNFKNSVDIEKYVAYMQNFLNYINDIIVENDINFMIKSKQVIAPLIASPAQMSVEDGTHFAALNRISDYSQYQVAEDLKFGEHLYHHFTHCLNSVSVLNPNSQCTESGIYALMINPDGGIAECACSYIQDDEKYLSELLNQNKYQEYRISKMRSKYFFNPNNATQEDWDEYSWYVLDGLRDTETVQISLALALATELAVSRQIDYSYFLNKNKLFKHLNACGMIFSCTREQINDTKIPFLCSANDCRRNLNGLVDYINDSRTDEGKFKIEYAIKHRPNLE